MSINICKQGLNDSIQDEGRLGYAGYGINPAGVMDKLAMRTANALVSNPLNTEVLEMHFPAATLQFNSPALIALSGADFNAVIEWNDRELPVEINKTIWMPAGAVLKFRHKEFGEWCCLAVHGGFDLPAWLGSYSTQFSVGKGGFGGRRLKKADKIPLRKKAKALFDAPKLFAWRAAVYTWYDDSNTFNILTGNEWDWMEPVSQKHFLSTLFRLSPQSDRMGSRLEGMPLSKQDDHEMISSPGTYGTIQLLPDGQMIVLMADHPTVGGYPRIAHVISAHLPKLAQTTPGTEIRFGNTDMETAEQLYLSQQKEVEQLQLAVRFQLATVLAGM